MSFLIFIVGILLGWKFREYTAVRKMQKMMKRAEEETSKPPINKITVNIEKHNNMFYLFNKETDEFVIQGKTKEEILENLKKRFGNVDMVFHATSENIKEVGFK